MFSGLLPHSDILGKYNAILPGVAQIIITIAENQDRHEMGIENKVINSNSSNSKRGQILGFIISITGIAIYFMLFLSNHEVVGGHLVGTTLVSLVSAFVIGTIKGVMRELK